MKEQYFLSDPSSALGITQTISLPSTKKHYVQVASEISRACLKADRTSIKTFNQYKLPGFSGAY